MLNSSGSESTREHRWWFLSQLWCVCMKLQLETNVGGGRGRAGTWSLALDEISQGQGGDGEGKNPRTGHLNGGAWELKKNQRERQRLGTSEGLIKEGDLEERAFGLSLPALGWGRKVCLLDEETGVHILCSFAWPCLPHLGQYQAAPGLVPPVPSGWPSQHMGSWPLEFLCLKQREARVGKASGEWWDVCQTQAETWLLIKEGAGREHHSIHREAEPALRLMLVRLSDRGFRISYIKSSMPWMWES